MAKQSYKDRNGTTRVGDALRWLVSKGKKVAPELLDIAGNITGIESLNLLSDKIKNDGQLAEIDKQMLLAELEFDVIEMQEVTKRWTSDNEHLFTRLVRPVSYAGVLGLFGAVIIADGNILSFTVNPSFAVVA